MTAAAAPAVRPGRTSPATRPLTAPARPRRVSGPARRGAGAPAARPDEHRGIALGLIAAVERLSRHRLLGGRAWIGLVAFALIGIVTMQLGLLKLNAGIGRAIEHEALLQRENAALSIENSELAASGRVTSLAARLGMEPVPAGGIHFLQVRPRLDARLGAAALNTPVAAQAADAGEPLAGSSSTATSPSSSPEQATMEATSTQASSEPSTTGSTATPRPAEPSTTEPATSASHESTGEAVRPAGESADGTGSGESSTPQGAGSSSGEGTPAGGTRAGPSG